MKYNCHALQLERVNSSLKYESSESVNKVDIKGLLVRQRRRACAQLELDSTLSIKSLISSTPKKYRAAFHKKVNKSTSEVKASKKVFRKAQQIQSKHPKIKPARKAAPFNPLAEKVSKWSDKFITKERSFLNDQFLQELVKSVIAQSLKLSLIHICRCRRYAVCRSRWSPYH
eukprot:TRINITY_DN14897_c0_g1_i2.p2 TRINITY_DN14897_c0_g1~~TRINITY_DN14897_c0_g1_i2.p2  ORF type:complete len:172 (+),score=23.78 TRINITY_DN14897_c0_g1_i2:260-775(+)